MCKKCDELRDQVIANQSPETKAKLDKIVEVAKELETLLVDVMMPEELEQAPSPVDIEQRLVMFFEGEIDRVIRSATKRVMERWPDQVMSEEQEQELIDSLKALGEELAALPPEEPEPIEDIDITKLN